MPMAEKKLDTFISCKRSQHRMIEDSAVVWLGSNLQKNDQEMITHLQNIVDSVPIFTDPDECVDSLTDLMHGKVFLIISNDLTQQLVPLIEDISQIQSIYVFGKGELRKEQYRVKGIFDEIKPMCDALEEDIRQSNRSIIPISIIPSSVSPTNPNELDQSFMYTQILKDILLKMDYDDEAKKKLVAYCFLQNGTSSSLKIIKEFDEKYPDPSPIWWYTRECFLYRMMNKALRIQDVEVIIKMGFFVRDLHQQIERLFSASGERHRFTVYRGQGMSNAEFTKLSESGGGLLSFNNFLSTSTNRSVAQRFAKKVQRNPDLIGVLFQMEIDPSISSTPFVSTDNLGYYRDAEHEIIFSMHTVFRIGEMKQIENRFWQVNLALTSDNDEQLTRLTEYIRWKSDAPTEQCRLSSLMFLMGEYVKADELFRTLLESTSTDDWTMLASLHHMLGYVNHEMGNQALALTHYQQSLEIEQKHVASNDPKSCRNYSGIGMILKEQSRLDEALEHFQRSLDIDLHASNPVQLNLATHYNNIGGVLDDQGKHTEALANYERTLEIELKELPSDHPSISNTYTNIAGTYDSLKDYSTSLEYYKKALEIQEKRLPSNHPWLSTTYNNMADVYDSLDDSSSALLYYKRALEAQEKSCLSKDPSLATVHYNIARTLEDLDRYPEAIEHATQAVDIVHRAYEPEHPEVTEYQEYLDELCQKLETLV